MADKEVTLHFKVDAAQATAELENLAKKAAGIGADSASNGSAATQQEDVDGNTAGMQEWADALEKVQSALNKVAEAVKTANDAFKENEDGATGMETAFSELSEAAEELGKRLLDLEYGGRAFKSSFLGNAGVLEAFDELVSTLGVAQNALRSFGSSFSAEAWENVAATVKAAQEKFAELAETLGGVSVGMAEINKLAGNVELSKLYSLLEQLLEVNKNNAVATRDRAAADREATNATKARADAEEAAAASSQKQKTADEDEQYRLKITLLNKSQLVAETQRLREEREKAAAVQDVERYNLLSKRLAACNTQMRELNRAQQLNRLATIQSAQAGVQFAQQLTTFGEQLKSGQMGIAGFANGLMGLAQSFRSITAGGNPYIAGAMVAIQLFDIALKKYAKEQEALRKQNEETHKSNMALAASYQSLEAAYERLERQQVNEEKIRRQAFAYGEISRAFNAIRASIDEQVSAENRLYAVRERHRKNDTSLEELRIRREVLEGTIKQEEAEKRIRELRLKNAVAAAQEEKRRADAEARSAAKVAEEAQKRLEQVQKEIANEQVSFNGFEIDPRIIEESGKRLKELQKVMENSAKLLESIEGDTSERAMQLRQDLVNNRAKVQSEINSIRNNSRRWNITAENMGYEAYGEEYRNRKALEERQQVELKAAREAADAADRDRKLKDRTAREMTAKANEQIKFLDEQNKEQEAINALQKKEKQKQENHAKRMESIRRRISDMSVQEMQEALKAVQNRKVKNEGDRKRREAEEKLYKNAIRAQQNSIDKKYSKQFGVDDGELMRGVNKAETRRNAAVSANAILSAMRSAKASKNTLEDDKELMQWLVQNQDAVRDIMGKASTGTNKKLLDALRELTQGVKAANDATYNTLAAEIRALKRNLKTTMK